MHKVPRALQILADPHALRSLNKLLLSCSGSRLDSATSVGFRVQVLPTSTSHPLGGRIGLGTRDGYVVHPAPHDGTEVQTRPIRHIDQSPRGGSLCAPEQLPPSRRGEGLLPRSVYSCNQQDKGWLQGGNPILTRTNNQVLLLGGHHHPLAIKQYDEARFSGQRKWEVHLTQHAVLAQD
jgi:hypothetical protein